MDYIHIFVRPEIHNGQNILKPYAEDSIQHTRSEAVKYLAEMMEYYTLDRSYSHTIVCEKIKNDDGREITECYEIDLEKAVSKYKDDCALEEMENRQHALEIRLLQYQ